MGISHRFRSRFKLALGTLAVIVTIGVLVYLEARSDYTWSATVTKQATAEGWVLIADRDNVLDIAVPWSWFNSPVTGLWFTRPNEVYQMDSIVVAPILAVTYNYTRTEQSQYMHLLNLKTAQSAHIYTVDIEATNFENLEWHAFPSGTPGDKLIRYFTAWGMEQ